MAKGTGARTGKKPDRATKAKLEQARRRQQRQDRRRRALTWGGSFVGLAAIVGGLVAIKLTQGSATANAAEVLPPGVGSGPAHVEPPALVVKNTSGIPGVVMYDTAGWPAASHNGPPAKALPHNHLNGPITYSVTPPVGGDHNGEWMNCGVYNQPVPNERAVHNLEHGAVWITYRPNLPKSEVTKLRGFFDKQSPVSFTSGGQTVHTGLRYLDLTPYPGLPAPIVASAWGAQLRLTSPTDPRLQRFVNTFRSNPRYTPEYSGQCNGAVGTPLAS